MKPYRATVVYRYYQTITVAADDAEQAKRVMLEEFSTDNADCESEVLDLEEIVLDLTPNQAAFAKAYAAKVDVVNEDAKEIVAMYFHRKNDKGFTDEFGMSTFTKITDHWDMWVSAHSYLMDAIKQR